MLRGSVQCIIDVLTHVQNICAQILDVASSVRWMWPQALDG